MKRIMHSRKRFFFVPILAIGFLFLVSFLVMLLWNHTLPTLFGFPLLTLWQAMGLFILCKLLFGFGGGPKGRGPWQRRCDRFADLNPEQKEKMKAYMRRRQCHWGNEGNETTKKENDETATDL